MASERGGIITGYRPECTSRDRREMAGEDVVGVGRVERTSIDERGIKRCEAQLQAIRYELFVDPGVRSAMPTTLRTIA